MHGSFGPHRLVIGALQAAFTLFGTQMAASIVLANGNGTAVGIRWAGGVVPYLGIQTTPNNFIPLMSWSVALAVVVTTTSALWNLLRRREDPSLVLGWGSGLLMSLVLIAMHWIRHLLDPPLIDLWILAQALAYVVAVSFVFVAYRPRFESEQPTRRADAATTSALPRSKQPALENS